MQKYKLNCSSIITTLKSYDIEVEAEDYATAAKQAEKEFTKKLKNPKIKEALRKHFLNLLFI